MPCEPNSDSFLSSSSFENDSKSDDDNADNELTKPSDEEMKKKENFGGFD